MKSYLSLILLVFLAINLYAQKDEEYQLYMLGIEGTQLINEKKYEEAIDKFNQAIAIAPDAIEFHYEKALAFTLNKQGDSAISTLEEIITWENATDHMYQLLATNYVVSKRGNDAVRVLREGLKRFPKSGRLYMELAGTEHGQQNLSQVLPLWEKGVEVDPNFPGNYFYLADYFSYTGDRIWSMIYGEIYLNLATNIRKIKLISQMIYDVINYSVFTPDIDNDEGMLFTSIDIKTSNPESFKGPFEWHAQYCYRETIKNNLNPDIEILSIEKINDFRKGFIKCWYESELHKRFDNKLFDYQRKIIQNGHNEAYGFWLFKHAMKDIFDSWLEKNEEEYDSFINWKEKNPLLFNEENVVYRLKYK